jgi:hypothetical protein
MAAGVVASWQPLGGPGAGFQAAVVSCATWALGCVVAFGRCMGAP